MESTAYSPAASEFSVGSVFSRTFSTLCRKPGVFIGITLVAWVPETILRIFIPDSNRVASFGLFVVSSILNLIVYGAISYAVLKVLKNEEAAIGESLSRSASCFGPLVGVSILTGLGTTLGMVLLLVPGLILMCMWSVSTSACVVERLDSFQSMQRSAALTKGHRWKIFGLLTLLIIAWAIVGGIVSFAVARLFLDNRVLLVLMTNLVLLFPQTFGSVMSPVIYYSLRSVKEGVSIDSLANVFD